MSGRGCNRCKKEGMEEFWDGAPSIRRPPLRVIWSEILPVGVTSYSAVHQEREGEHCQTLSQ